MFSGGLLRAEQIMVYAGGHTVNKDGSYMFPSITIHLYTYSVDIVWAQCGSYANSDSIN